MSLLKMILAQLGLSATPANNFTLDASADNGTMKLARGNAGATTQDIMTVDADGKVAFPQGPVQTGPAFAAVMSGVGTINGLLVLQMSETLDTDNAYAAGQFNPKVAGYYQVNCSARFNAVTSISYAGLLIRKNGVTGIADKYSGPYATSYAGTACSALVYLNGTTDYVEIVQDLATVGAATIVTAASSAALVRK